MSSLCACSYLCQRLAACRPPAVRESYAGLSVSKRGVTKQRARGRPSFPSFAAGERSGAGASTFRACTPVREDGAAPVNTSFYSSSRLRGVHCMQQALQGVSAHVLAPAPLRSPAAKLGNEGLPRALCLVTPRLDTLNPA